MKIYSYLCKSKLKSSLKIMPQWWNGRHEGLKQNLSALRETLDVEPP